MERARGRSTPLDIAFESIERDSEIGGGILAGALAYRLFIFALPLAFFLVALLGLVADVLGKSPATVGRHAGFAGAVTRQVATAANGPSNAWVAIGSFLVLAYVTRVLLRALAIVHALAWERSAAFVKVSSRSFAIFGAALVAQLVLIGLVGRVREVTAVGGVAALPLFIVGIGAIWLAVSLQLPHSQARWTDLVPGAGLYALGALLVQVFSAYFLGWLLESKSSTYGALGAAAAVLLGLFLIGRVTVVSAVLNATLFERRNRSRADAHPGESGSRAMFGPAESVMLAAELPKGDSMAFGPIQLLVLGFSEPKFEGAVVAELDRLKENDIVRVIDALAIHKDAEGNVKTLKRTDLTDDEAAEFGAVVGALLGLGAAGAEGAEAGAKAGAEATAEGVDAFPEAQAWDVVDEIPNDTAAALILLEHRWAIPLRNAVLEANGFPISDGFIHPLDLVAVGVLAAEDAEALTATKS